MQTRGLIRNISEAGGRLREDGWEDGSVGVRLMKSTRNNALLNVLYYNSETVEPFYLLQPSRVPLRNQWTLLCSQLRRSLQGACFPHLPILPLLLPLPPLLPPLLQPLPKLIQPLPILPLPIPNLPLTRLLKLLAPVRNISLELLCREEAAIHDPHTGLGRLGGGEAHGGDAGGLAVEEDDVGDFSDFGAFVADVFFDFEGGGGVFL